MSFQTAFKLDIDGLLKQLQSLQSMIVVNNKENSNDKNIVNESGVVKKDSLVKQLLRGASMFAVNQVESGLAKYVKSTTAEPKQLQKATSNCIQCDAISGNYIFDIKAFIKSSEEHFQFNCLSNFSVLHLQLTYSEECKFSITWERVFDDYSIAIPECCGTTYHCSIDDVGFRLIARVKGFDKHGGELGSAIVTFEQVKLHSSLLGKILLSLQSQEESFNMQPTESSNFDSFRVKVSPIEKIVEIYPKCTTIGSKQELSENVIQKKFCRIFEAEKGSNVLNIVMTDGSQQTVEAVSRHQKDLFLATVRAFNNVFDNEYISTLTNLAIDKLNKINEDNESQGTLSYLMVIGKLADELINLSNCCLGLKTSIADILEDYNALREEYTETVAGYNTIIAKYQTSSPKYEPKVNVDNLMQESYINNLQSVIAQKNDEIDQLKKKIHALTNVNQRVRH